MADRKAPAVEERRFGPTLTAPPVVSVLMITYNHERFIRQAIEGVFMQQVDFPIELVIGEDRSTDATLAAIEQICASAPISVRVLTSENNVGMHANFRRTLMKCCGKFVALIEGDDYWTAPNKLQLQRGILESDDQIALCFLRAIVRYESTDQYQFGAPNSVIDGPEAGYVPNELILKMNFLLPTGSAMARKDALCPLPTWIDGLCFGDLAYWAIAAGKGKTFCLDDVCSVYRFGSGVSIHFDDDIIRDHQRQTLQFAKRDALPRFAPLFHMALVERLQWDAHLLELSGRLFECRQLVKRLLLLRTLGGEVSPRPFVWLLRLYFPAAYRTMRAMLSLK